MLQSVCKEPLILTCRDATHVWIGLNDMQTDETYRWSDGTQKNYEYFWTDEPNGGPGLHGVRYNKRAGGVRKWADKPMSNEYDFVCKSDACRDGGKPPFKYAPSMHFFEINR